MTSIKNKENCAVCGEADHSKGQTHPFSPTMSSPTTVRERLEKEFGDTITNGVIHAYVEQILVFIEKECSAKVFEVEVREIEYSQFEKLMSEYVSLCEDENALLKAFRKLDPDFNYIGFGRHHEITMQALKLAVNDKYDYISYWLYDLDKGKKWHKGSITDRFGKDIPLKTIRQLYNCIKNEK